MSISFHKSDILLEGVYRINRKPHQDIRGAFGRFFCQKEFKKIGLKNPIVQMNYSFTKNKGTIRGMHYQSKPNPEAKIVTCLQGKIIDIVVDLRKGSPTFLQWHGEILSAEDQSSLFVPEGFAHGFQTLTDDCHLLYLHSNYYSPESEGALNAFDPILHINWPLSVSEMSEKDKKHPYLNRQFKGIDF